MFCELTRLHDFTVSPDTFNIIKQTALFIEYVHDDIAIIHQNPVCALVAFYLLARVSGFAKLFPEASKVLKV